MGSEMRCGVFFQQYSIKANVDSNGNEYPVRLISCEGHAGAHILIPRALDEYGQKIWRGEDIGWVIDRVWIPDPHIIGIYYRKPGGKEVNITLRQHEGLCLRFEVGRGNNEMADAYCIEYVKHSIEDLNTEKASDQNSVVLRIVERSKTRKQKTIVRWDTGFDCYKAVITEEHL